MTTKFDKRISELENKIAQAGKLPKSERGPYIGWSQDDEDADFSETRDRLLKKYGTLEGAQFISLSWQSD